MKRRKTLLKDLLNFFCIIIFILSTSNSILSQSCADGSYSFDDDIAPILNAKCGNCHGTQGGYSVATYASTIAGGNNCGPAVTPGNATATGSSLIDKLQWVIGGPNATCGANMPTSGTPLTTAEYMAIEAWIEAGAQENCPPATCPTSEFTQAEPDLICEGATLDFLLDIEVIDTDGTQLGNIMWFASTNPAVDPMVDVTAPVDHTGANPCGTFSITYYAFVQCDANLDGIFDLNNGDQWTQIATYIFGIIPAPQVPVITLDDDVCNYTITPACPTDMLSTTTLTAAPGEDPAPIDVVVVSSLYCEGIVYQVDPPACPDQTTFECPTSSWIKGFPGIDCDLEVLFGTPEDNIDVDQFISDPDGTQLGGVVWFIGTNGPTVDPMIDVTVPYPLVHSGANPCAEESIYVYAAIQCDADLDGVFDLNNGDEWISVVYFTVRIPPPVQVPTITLDDDVCNYILTPACPDDVLNPATIPPATPGDDPAVVSVNVTNLQGCSDDFMVDPPPCPPTTMLECPTAESFQFQPLFICDGAVLPSLEDAAITYNISDPDGTQLGGLMWFLGNGFNVDPTVDPMVDINAPVVHSGADPCNTDPLAVYNAFIQCDANLDGVFDLNNGDQWIEVVSYAFIVLPPKQAPIITLDDDVCNYTITPACPIDVLSITTLTAAPGEDPPPIDVMVGNACPATFQLDPPACPATTAFDCPTSDFSPSAPELICDGATLMQVPMAGNQFNIIDPDGTLLGGIMWFTGLDPMVDPPADVTASVVHSGTDPCAADPPVTYYAFIQCDADLDGVFDLNNGDQWIQVASFTYEVYPSAQPPTIVRFDNVCNYIIVPACPVDMLDVFSVIAAPGEDPAPININVTTENGCTGAFTVDPELCPAPTMFACPTSETFFFQPEYICEGNVLTFDGNTYTISDPDGTQLGGVIWFAGPDPTVDPVVDITAPVVHPGPDFCDAVDVFIYAFVQCDADLDGVFDLNNGDQWIGVNGHWYILLPAKQIPIITLDDDVCNYTITPACPGDVLSITTLTAAPGEDPAPIDVEVGMACTTTFQIDPPACPTSSAFDCPNGEIIQINPDFACEGLPLYMPEANITDPDGTQLGDVMWFTGPDPTVDPLVDFTAPIVLSGADPCATEDLGIYGFVQCDADLDGVFDLNNGDQWTQVHTYAWTVFPAKQMPVITLDDDVCNYTITPACPGDVLSITTLTAAPGEDPAPIDVEVGMACTTTFQIDPPACQSTNSVCQGIDIAAGIPIVPTGACSGATTEICLTLVDAAEGLVITGSIDSTPVTLMGTASGNPNELCVAITAPLNETCDVVDVVIQIDAIQCINGEDYPGILGGATLVDDLTDNGLNPLNVPVYPTLAVNTSGDGACGTLTAELVANDGAVCATATGSPFTCSADGETLDYDFFGDITFAPPATLDCQLPVLTGTLTCGSCGPCEDPIMGTVITDEPTCDLAGTMVEILDSNGMPVAGSPVTIDAMGNYSLPGPFACGTYTAEIVAGSAPQCYYDLSGTDVPFEFEVDGDGVADGVNFTTLPQVPTLSQWGLIILALLMMCFGAIKMTYNREKILSRNSKIYSL